MTESTGSAGLSIGQCASLACLLEATAPKPGNVHRGADFDDVTYLDFVLSAVLIAPAMEAAAAAARVGATVLAGVEATRSAVNSNTNLGTLLLLAPLARVPRHVALDAGVRQVLDDLDATDAENVYAAIRRARPGGLGKVPEADVVAEPPDDLLAAMALASDKDLVARQYVNGFAEVFGRVLPQLRAGLEAGWSLNDAIVRAALLLLSEFPDSLIARKCGPEIASQSAVRARAVLAAGLPGDWNYQRALADFDFWLRADHHRRNPGTTADLIAAGLFAALRDGIIKPPFRFS